MDPANHPLGHPVKYQINKHKSRVKFLNEENNKMQYLSPYKQTPKEWHYKKSNLAPAEVSLGPVSVIYCYFVYMNKK